MEENVLAYKLLNAFEKYSSNPALQVDGRTYSYAELFAAAALRARYILDKYPDHYGPVAIPGGKTFQTYAGICGALLASRAYMPLNSKFPEARNNTMIKLSGAIVLGTDIPVSGEPESEKIEITTGPDDTAYLLFTSGTTGTPKGVPVSNMNICAYLDHVLAEWDFREDDRFTQTFDLTFDLSVHDMFVCWLSGACLCIPEDDSPFKLAKYIKEQAISIWFSVPSVAVLMNKMRLLKERNFDRLRLSFFCGEPLTAEIAGKWQAATGNRLINLYGPSEATIAISAYEWKEGSRKEMNGIVSLGKIFREQDFLLLDEKKMNRHPDRGELCLGGRQVIKAYLNDPELSAKYFIKVEGEQGIWYRSGDLACLDDDGELYFLGRSDTEVKISGYRVNLMEIEAVVRKAGAGEVAALLHDKATPGIVCWISGQGNITERSILEACRKELPWYMIPERIIFVEEMPLNMNGKVDRNKLKSMLHGQE